MPPTPDLSDFDTNRLWKNLHATIKARPKRLYRLGNRWLPPRPQPKRQWKPGLAALQAIVQEAERQNVTVRGLGGGWSLSNVAVTPDFMADTRTLNLLEVGFTSKNCDPSLNGARDRLVFAQCGITVLELNRELELRGLSIPTSGASNGQTIAGAVSTGTHGAANQVGATQDFILGFHLVSEGGDHCWVERQSRPAVTQAFCDILGARLVRDDRLFKAALVSFGSFGLIHAVLFEAEPIYLLEQYVRRFDYPAVREHLATLDLDPLGLKGGPGLPFHFEVVLNPYAAGAGERGAYLRWMLKRPFAAGPPPADPTVVTALGDDLLAIIGGLTGAIPELIPGAVTSLLNSQFPENLTGSTATHGKTFGATHITRGGLSCELGVAVADTPAAVDAILEVARTEPFAGVIALRFVRSSDALLAFTCFAPYTCTIELPAADSPRSRRAYEKIWDLFEERQIPHTFHWGQALRPNFARLQQVFGARLQQWLDARRAFLTPNGRKTFSNPFLQQWGLDA